jgi:hypothetical protein
MPLIDMKYTKAERKDEATEPSSPEGGDYPCGLCIRLESEELNKLGIDELPGAGAEFTFTATATVTGVNQTASLTQAPERSIALQITMLDVKSIESAQEEKDEPASGESAEMKRGSTLMATY